MPKKRKRSQSATRPSRHKVRLSGVVVAAAVELGYFSRKLGDLTGLRLAVDN